MRRLILMRHAKSSWAGQGQADIDRPLNGRGRRAARSVGIWLRASGFVPDHALVSSAARTRETWDGLTETLGSPSAVWEPALYEADAAAMLRVLRDAPEAAAVLMIGHQPGTGDFARRLLAEPVVDADFARYPTGAVAVIDFEVETWKAVAWRTGRLEAFTVPRRLE